MANEHHWTLLTNHGACLLMLATASDSTLREIAESLGITERSTARILADLKADGYVDVRRVGRRNEYVVNLEAPLRHPIGQGQRVVDLLGGVIDRAGGPPTRKDAGEAATPPLPAESSA